jgi:carbon storage regulator
MLVLSRKRNEVIVIDGNIRITVVGIRGNQVRLGIEAPGSVGVFREELCRRAAEHGHATHALDADHAPEPAEALNN